MGKRFNINGLCIPEKHYMVDISNRLGQIKQLVKSGEYFTINRGRQYGKTTTLYLLKEFLENEYTVFLVSFEGMGPEMYEKESTFFHMLLRLLQDTLEYNETKNVSEAVKELLLKVTSKDFGDIDSIDFASIITNICMKNEKPVVLMIDEVDQASNYSTFLSFLGILRDKYLKRGSRPTFQSVILAGVYDIKNLKLKVRESNEHQYNSPWNIAAKFPVDMSFSVKDIQGMLSEYEKDYHTGMNLDEISTLFFDYTAGYPFLVSAICKIMDEQLTVSTSYAGRENVWTRNGFLEAVRILLSESNTLFDDMRKKLEDYPELKRVLYEILFTGKQYSFNVDDFAIDVAKMFDFIENDRGNVALANRIFETRLYNLFLSEEKTTCAIIDEGARERNQFIHNNELDMEHILQRFVVHFTELYGDSDETFLEKMGRKYFLFYLKPIINGTGNYYIEAQTRDSKRTDLIVDYLGKQYIIEMKIWHGNEYNVRGEKQLLEYLDSYHLQKGYMLSFNFNKKKDVGVRTIQVKDKILVEAVV